MPCCRKILEEEGMMDSDDDDEDDGEHASSNLLSKLMAMRKPVPAANKFLLPLAVPCY